MKQFTGFALLFVLAAFLLSSCASSQQASTNPVKAREVSYNTYWKYHDNDWWKE